EGTSLAPGESMTANVTFAPMTTGNVTDHWDLNADGDEGAQTVTLRGIGVVDAGAPDAGTASDAGTGGGAPPASDGGCTSAAGPALMPLLLLLGGLLRHRRPRFSGR